MGSLYPFDPTGPVVPDIPPICIGALTVGLTDLFRQAGGLALPRHAMINELSQAFALQFAPVADSSRVITSWAMRFGGVVEAHTCEPAPGQPHRHIKLTFDYFGVTVEAYALFPLSGQENPS